MNGSAAASWLLLVGTAVLAALGAAGLARTRGALRYVLAAAVLAGAVASILMVDVNVPLSQSHFRPSGEPAPAWVALTAWLLRILPLFIPIALARRRGS
jgi:hypothetical protein